MWCRLTRRYVRDERLLCQDNLLGGSRVGGEQPPVDEAAVPQVGVLTVLCRQGENLYDSKDAGVEALDLDIIL